MGASAVDRGGSIVAASMNMLRVLHERPARGVDSDGELLRDWTSVSKRSASVLAHVPERQNEPMLKPADRASSGRYPEPSRRGHIPWFVSYYGIMLNLRSRNPRSRASQAGGIADAHPLREAQSYHANSSNIHSYNMDIIHRSVTIAIGGPTKDATANRAVAQPGRLPHWQTN
jgi:hypothetical protein